MNRILTGLPAFHPGIRAAKATWVGDPAIKQWLMRMYAVITLLFTLFLTGIAGESSAQRVSFTGAKLTLSAAMASVSDQTGYYLMTGVDLRTVDKEITLIANNRPLRTVMADLLSGTTIDYVIDDERKTIVLKEAPRAEARTGAARRHAITHVSEEGEDLILALPECRGKIVDSMGVAISGASVRALNAEGKRTSLQTQTDRNGEFVLHNVPEDALLEFTYIGYIAQQVKVQPHIGVVVLKMLPSALEEIEINAGYWKVNEKLRTGSISKVSGETIRQQPVLDPMLALAGRVSGLVISQQSGLPGAYHSLRIRGTNSLANGNDPLFLIDGLPFVSEPLSNRVIGSGAARISPFALLNAEEIESIEVLKDADATAIYGSRGANGVILITTKKGRPGKTAVNLNASTGFGKITRTMDMLNTEQYLEMRREAFSNDGITSYPANAYDVNGTWDQTRYTDWQKVLIGNTARTTNIQGQISGGTTNTQFLVGGGYNKETTVVPGNFSTKKGSISFNLNHQSENRKFSFSLSTRYANNLTDQPQTDPAINLMRLAPNAPKLYDDQGNLNWENETWINPMSEEKKRSNFNSKNLIFNAALKYKIRNELELVLNTGYNDLSTVGSNITPITAFSPVYAHLSTRRRHNRSESDQDTWIIEPQINYKEAFTFGKFEGTLGSTFQKSNNYTLAHNANNFSDDALLENFMSAAIISVAENRQTEYRYAALFARVNYNFLNKYLVNLVARRDGSTRFAPGKQYGNFASIGAAWIFSNEAIFNGSVLSFGKFRVSYGVTGNDQSTDYQYLSTYSSYNYPYLGITGLYPTRLYTSDYGWEAVRKLEGALDLSFWKDRGKLSTVYYRNRTDNQLVGYPLPTMTGFAAIQGNLPAVLENSGWEWELTSINVSNARLTWNTSFNISVPNSKLVAYPEFEKSSYRNMYEIGKPLSISKVYHWTGVDPQTGIHTYEDVDKDGKISSPQDLQSRYNLGRKYYGGLANTINYKGFSLDIFFQFENRIRSGPGTVPGAFVNQPTKVLGRWQKPGDITNVQRFTQSGIAATTMVTGLNNSDMLYEDASFLRLKNLSFSYQVPTNLINKYWLRQCILFIQSQNLITFTSYSGLDPETELSLAPIKMITAGISLTL